MNLKIFVLMTIATDISILDYLLTWVQIATKPQNIWAIPSPRKGLFTAIFFLYNKLGKIFVDCPPLDQFLLLVQMTLVSTYLVPTYNLVFSFLEVLWVTVK